MPRTATLKSLCVIAYLVVASPAAAQPLEITLSNGCDVYEMVDGGLEFQPFGHLGSLSMQKVGSDQTVWLVFECIDFPLEPETERAGIQQSSSICNWRMQGKGKGTNRAEVRWFPGPASGQLSFSVNAQVIRGNRYPTGVTSAHGAVDESTGTISIDSFVAVYCKKLGG